MSRETSYQGHNPYLKQGMREYEVFLEGIGKQCVDAIAETENQVAANHIGDILDFVREECGAIKAAIQATH